MSRAFNWIKELPISRKLTLLMMTTAAVALFLGGVAFVANDLFVKRSGMLSQQATLAEIVGLNSIAALDFDDARSARETLTALEADPEVMAAAIYSGQDLLFAQYNSPGFPDTDIPASPGIAGQRFTLDYLETFQPVLVRDQKLGTVFIRTSTNDWYVSLQRNFLTGFAVMAIVGLISLALSHVLQRNFSAPVLELAGFARMVSRTRSYSLRARKYSEDELGTLVDDFNAMLEEIEQRDMKLSEYQQGLEREVQSRTADLQQLTERLEHQAHHDSLTGLPNRKRYKECCHDTLAERSRDGGQFAVMFLDLERFKLVNDSLGHHVGDRLLNIVARRLRNCVREGDMVARQGGDEFTVLLRSVSGYEDATSVAERILAALAPCIELEAHTLNITGSIGISLYPYNGTTVDELLRHADVAMYAAKSKGGNGFLFFSDEMRTEGAELLSLEAELHRAVDEQQFEAYYQPIISAHDGRVRSFEALVRWRHPTSGMVSPGRFIPLAEETGLITEIDEWVFGEACRQVVIWRKKHLHDVSMTVNLSSRQFSRPDLSQRLEAILNETGATSDAIELEITEGTLMHQTEQVQSNLMKLKALGFRLAVDDFGTGYSSLSYLKRFPLDRLKVDQSFVQDLPHDQDNAAITQAVIAMARSLRLMVTVEGIETEEQLAFLQDLGCDAFQGFLYSQPVSADEAERYLYSRVAQSSAAAASAPLHQQQ
ncbi:EAL domain-containing protein [Marinobacter salarius]|jgi:diguanylate cyclase (GGDEF)-like protein|uniref:putative bifunctional diguanylate cyclase/phosphodiesterase n=1 Tax=Marinobacter salarius TaxID=1420917 RepID=UPI0018F136FE|nr:EAL domain-containing protein [Marinobacter salarius]MBJ7275176.1 EAL domain-containing protein [Marinobacter salarius]